MKIKVNSEIGRLKKVLLHRPGRELQNLTPDTLERLLFDDIPFLEVAQQEHDKFAELLEERGVEVFYIEKLVAEAINDEEAKAYFLEHYIDEAIDTNEYIAEEHKSFAKELLNELLNQYKDNQELVNAAIGGFRVSEVKGSEKLVDEEYPFFVDGMPNLYFQRDPFGSIGNGVSINRMYSVTRNRETLLAATMFKFHPMFENENIPEWFGRNEKYHTEGGDQLVINKNVIFVGISQRTQKEALDILAENILLNDGNDFNRLVGIDIGQSRKYMHLDTVFTQIDHNKFTAHPDAINEEMTIIDYKVEDGEVNKETKENTPLLDIVKEATGRDDIEFIACAGGDPVDSAAEQWNDGANTLCLQPGEVFVYQRNSITNKILEDKGIKLNVVPSAEISRGRGGPRCMSMPLEREEI